MYRTHLVISLLELVLITINYMPQIVRFNGYNNMSQLSINFDFMMRNNVQYKKKHGTIISLKLKYFYENEKSLKTNPFLIEIFPQ
jgi:hypothetical protein